MITLKDRHKVKTWTGIKWDPFKSKIWPRFSHSSIYMYSKACWERDMDTASSNIALNCSTSIWCYSLSVTNDSTVSLFKNRYASMQMEMVKITCDKQTALKFYESYWSLYAELKYVFSINGSKSNTSVALDSWLAKTTEFCRKIWKLFSKAAILGECINEKWCTYI